MHNDNSMIGLVNIVLRRPRLLILPLLTGGTSLSLAVVRGPAWRAESSLRPRATQGQASRFAGLAGQFGISLPGSDVGDPVRFYAAVANSRDILRDLAETRVHPGGPGKEEVTLLAYLGWKEGGDATAIAKALDHLAKRLQVTTSRDAGLVFLRTTFASPELAEEVNERWLELLNKENVRRRQEVAGLEREFMDAQLAGALAQLGKAEKALEVFLEENRQYGNSPDLVNEHRRRERRIDLALQVYVGLAQAVAQARLNEVRNTPVLVVIGHPEGSARRAGSMVVDGIVWTLIGALVAFAMALGLEALRRERVRNPEGFAELAAHLHSLSERIRFSRSS